MTNYDKIVQNFSIEKCAEMMVHEILVDEGDYDMDDEYQSFYVTCWTFDDTTIYDSPQEAIEDCIKWLMVEI